MDLGDWALLSPVAAQSTWNGPQRGLFALLVGNARLRLSWVENQRFLVAAIIFNGIDPIAESFGDDARCSIYIMSTFTDEKSVETRLSRTSFAHNGESHPFVRIGVTDPLALNLFGKGDSGQEEMRLTLKQAGMISSLFSAGIRCLHSDHFHNDVCERLVQHQATPQ